MVVCGGQTKIGLTSLRNFGPVAFESLFSLANMGKRYNPPSLSQVCGNQS